MRTALWPDCTEEMHRLEMAALRGGKGMTFVYRRANGRLGGFIELSVRKRVDGSMEPRVGYVEGWYVDEDLRGQGLGRELMAKAEEWAREKGLRELASDAEIENEGSIEAHRQLGFSETFRLVHFLKKLT